MKIMQRLFILLGIILSIQGCTEDKKNDFSSKEYTYIKGKTTLSSGLRKASQAIVCVDINYDNICNEDEPQGVIDHQGNYEFNSSIVLIDGDILLIRGGRSVLPPNEENKFLFSKYYIASEESQNINIMSSFIVKELENNSSIFYVNAVEKMMTFYHFDKEVILSNPLDNAQNFFGEGQAYFKFMSALEIKFKNQSKQKASKNQNKFIFFPFPDIGGEESNTLPPSAEEVNQVIAENEDLFNLFFDALSEYYNYFLSWFDGNEVVVLEGNSDLSFEEPPVIAPINRDELNGVWYIVDASGDEACTSISSNNNVSVTESTGKVTNLSLTIKGTLDDIKSMELNYGAFRADTINVLEYTTDHSFTGSYASDGETLIGTKMLNFEVCKEKLGL